MSEIHLNSFDIKQEKTDESMEVQHESFIIDETQIKEEPEIEISFTLPQQEDQDLIKNWEATAEEIEALKCRFCFKTSEYRSDFILHKRKHKPDDVKKEVKCDVCLKDLLEKNFRNHFDKHFNKKYPCQHQNCTMQFDFENQLLAHTKRLHSDTDFKFHCKECGRNFKVNASYQDHMVSHLTSDPKPFKCEMCPKEFTAKGNLGNHMKKSHKKDQVWACDECDFTSRGYGHLYQHKQRHSKNFECSFCDEKFSTRSDVSNHSVIHRLQKTMKCKECKGIMAKKSGTYTRQTEIFKCGKCEAIFKRVMWKEPGTKRSVKAKKVGRPLKEYPQGKPKRKMKKEVVEEVAVEEKVAVKKEEAKIQIQTPKPPKQPTTQNKNTATQVETTAMNTKFYRCVTCSYTTSSHLVIWKHRNQHILPYVCKICGDNFACRNQLYVHYQEEHQAVPSQELIDWDDVKERIENAPLIEQFVV